MANTFFKTLKQNTNYTYTENGAITHKSSLNKVYDMFAMGGAMRNRSDADVITMFRSAYEEDSELALKCLFYLRDILEGAGERRFFRVCLADLAKTDAAAVKRNIENVPKYGRWDDLFVLIDTPVENEVFEFIREQLILDINTKTPSLLGKWMPSENASSSITKYRANKICSYLGFTPKQYRKMLTELRARINVLETLMSANRWDEIEFDKIPSRAGLIYRNAFARHDVERAQAKQVTYAEFAKSNDTKVNARVLNPVDIADKAFDWRINCAPLNDTERLMLQKYWDNQKDWYNGRVENGIAVVDVSGSMTGQPMNAAVSMGAYIAERGKGPFANHFITFSSKPELVEFVGADIVDKFNRAKTADWQMNTNIEAVFDLLLNIALQTNDLESIPERIYIFSDMEFDGCMGYGVTINDRWGLPEYKLRSTGEVNTLFERIQKRWDAYGIKLPSVIFWNLDARQDNTPALGSGFNCVSGFSMSMVETILSGKDGIDLMKNKLLSDRYSTVR